MASKARVGRATVVSIGGITGVGGSEVFTPIEELTKASFTGGKWGTVDVSNFDSGVDEEFIANMRDNGSVDLGGNYLDSAPGQDALNAAYNTGEKYDFKVQLAARPGQTTGKLFTFSALVTSFFDIPVETKSAITFTSELKVSGPVVVTPPVLSA